MNDTLLHKRIMRRVCWTCYLKKVINPMAIKMYAIFALIVAIVSTISISNVIENTAHIRNLSGLYSFYLSAFTNTEVLVQVLILSWVGISFWLIRDLFLSKVRFV